MPISTVAVMVSSKMLTKIRVGMLYSIHRSCRTGVSAGASAASRSDDERQAVSG
jgi:hypothetical protein